MSTTPTKVTPVKTPTKDDPIPPSVETLEKKYKEEENEAAKNHNRTSVTPDLDLPQENGAASDKAETPEKPETLDTTEVIPQPENVIKISPTVTELKTNKRSRKRKSKRAADAPKFPLTGYVRYINERRETLKAEHPDSSHMDITKMLGDEWNNLADEKKKPYLEAADIDRKRYLQEMKDYEVTHPPPPKKQKTVVVPTVPDEPVKPQQTKTNDVFATDSKAPQKPIQRKPQKAGTREIQIFTDEFLEHNKEMETELKAVRKSFTDYELQNSNLERYIENMKLGIANMTNETAALKTKNAALEKYLNKLKEALASSLSSLSLPVEKGATVANIENYMTELAKMTAPHGIINKAKDSIRKLDLQSIQN